MARIDTLLVANRGEIAVRIIDAAHERGMRAVAVYSDADRDASHVTRADLAIALGGDTATESYLDASKVLDAARRSEADAIHPGYGFLSERADFARSVVDAGLVWVGPHPDAIATMGDKLAAKRLASQLGVPVLPSTEIDGDAPFEWRAQVGAVGYPLLVKAAAGGGGRGMRLVLTEDDLEDAVATARREATASFGDGTVFAERWLAAPRHIEVQVVADQHGHVAHLGERECSIQRRHQKLIEEAPSPAVDDLLRDQLGAAAVRLAEEIGYDSIGTVEFLLDADRGEFFFLEMNTRLQVEHRVTEEVWAFDLVELQLRAALGEELDFAQDEVDLDGHAIEVRLVAEDPADDWQPATGTVHRFVPPFEFGITCDTALRSGTQVTAHYDSLLAKVIATGETRDQAIGRLRRWLRALQLHGVRTNLDHLVAVLGSDDFRAGNTTTAFNDLHLTLLDAGPDDAALRTHVVAAALWGQHVRRRSDAHWSAAPTGWRNVGAASQQLSFEHDGRRIDVHYRIDGDTFRASVDDDELEGRFRITSDQPDGGTLSVEMDRVARSCSVHRFGGVWYVNTPDAQTALAEVPRFPVAAAASIAGGLTAPVPGRVVTVEVAAGDAVAAGQTLLVLEAMKVEHRVRAPADGKIVEVLVTAGDNVEAHQVLVQMDGP